MLCALMGEGGIGGLCVALGGRTRVLRLGVRWEIPGHITTSEGSAIKTMERSRFAGEKLRYPWEILIHEWFSTGEQTPRLMLQIHFPNKSRSDQRAL